MRRSRRATIKVTKGKEVIFENSVLVRGRPHRAVMFELKELAGYAGRRSPKVYEDSSVFLYKIKDLDSDLHFEITYSWLYSDTG